MRKLGQLFDQLKAFDRPPVEEWHPEKTVEFDLRIASSGEWIHEGGVIARHNLVKLLSTVLVFRGGDYYLVTPKVKYRIQVEEVPFLAVELRTRGSGSSQEIYFRTNMDEVVKADSMHPLQVNADTSDGQPRPYIEVRDGLRAKLTRPVYYELAELSALDHRDCAAHGVYSCGQFFKMI